jgi:hypothetical protein
MGVIPLKEPNQRDPVLVIHLESKEHVFHPDFSQPVQFGDRYYP